MATTRKGRERGRLSDLLYADLLPPPPLGRALAVGGAAAPPSEEPRA